MTQGVASRCPPFGNLSVRHDVPDRTATCRGLQSYTLENSAMTKPPITVFVVDVVGRATCGYVAVDDPASVTLNDARSKVF